MKAAVRCIYYKAVTPSCDIIEMDDTIWKDFLYSGGHKRKEIALKLLNKESMMGYVRVIAWITLDDQDKLREI